MCKGPVARLGNNKNPKAFVVGEQGMGGSLERGEEQD